jgi:triacylglycerol esterase/lipase EstA (alpha/beta hydrolase family)
MSKTLVVYVHGALSTKNSWNYIRQKLSEKLQAANAELPVEEFIRYNLNVQSSSEIVEEMIKKILKTLQSGDFKKLVMIGHSFGGVLSVATARALSEFLEHVKIKTRLITLSSPFAGSEIASILRVFRPGSMFFKNVGGHAEFIKNFKKGVLPYKTHIFVTTEGGADWMPQANDGVVTVESQLHFSDDPNASIQEVKVNHFEILLSDTVVGQLFKDAK